MNVSLTPQLESFVKQKVQTGMYTSVSEVIREALRLLEEHDAMQAAKLEVLRKDIRAGIDSLDRGESHALDIEAIKARGRPSEEAGLVGDLRVSVEAKQDLLEIWLYIADDSPENADHFLAKPVPKPVPEHNSG